MHVVALSRSKTNHSDSGVGYVRGGNSNIYFLELTNDVKIITGDRQRGWFVRPICWNIEQGYSCNFYEQSWTGHGPLIGQYEGFSDGWFGSEYAAYYKCWRTGDKRRDTIIENPRTGIERRQRPNDWQRPSDWQRPNDRHKPNLLASYPCGILGVRFNLDNTYNMDYANLNSLINNSFDLVILTSDTYGFLNITTTSAFLRFGHSDPISCI